MFRKAIIGITLSAMLGGSFAASLPRVNVVANAQAQAQSIKPTENTITYNYNGDTPLKLTGYSNSVVAYNEGVSNLQYNAQNEIIRDDHGNALDYDALGAMIEFTNVQSSVEVQYQYDAESHQSVESTFNNKGEVQTRESFYYSTGDSAQMIAESDNDGNQLSYLFAEEKIGSINNSDEANLYITDQAGSVVALVSNSQLSHEYVYSPYGIETDLDQSTTKAKNAQGFDGERTDKATGYQFLGNGYRAYNPILHRFMQMDDISYSPFGKGGINGYVFGNNNPIMNFDPSGHFSWSIFWSVTNYILNGLGVVGAIAATIASGGALGAPLIAAIAGGVSGALGITAQGLVDGGAVCSNSSLAIGLNIASTVLAVGSMGLDIAAAKLVGGNGPILSSAPDLPNEPFLINSNEVGKAKFNSDFKRNMVSFKNLPEGVSSEQYATQKGDFEFLNQDLVHNVLKDRNYTDEYILWLDKVQDAEVKPQSQINKFIYDVNKNEATYELKKVYSNGTKTFTQRVSFNVSFVEKDTQKIVTISDYKKSFT